MIGPKSSWKKTLHLPKSTFPARAQVKDRSKYIERCTADLYAWQRARQLPQKFTLHDGPPYANGHLHIGHALNKILKDIICRSRLSDHVVDWRPGWDCHGLPIELKALQQYRERATSSTVGIRAAARRLAAKTVQNQKQTFQKWGIMADWDNTWTTMDKDFEIKQLGVFQDMARNGLIYRRFKPVYWSPSSRTALAEAELEYRDDHVSMAAFAKYPLSTVPEGLKTRFRVGKKPLNAVIWTTTPWTLPANRAIGIHSDLEYTVAQSATHGWLLVASSRLSSLQHYLNETLDPRAVIDGKQLIGASYSDPTFGSKGPPRPFLHADFVSDSSGSGLVHLAPGHGMDEYLLCLNHNIAAFAPLDDMGCFTVRANPDEPGLLLGKGVLSTGNHAVLELLSGRSQLLGQHEYTHTYPYDWRSKQPVIVRATEQWFANVGKIREDALRALECVKFIPSTSISRLRAFVENRSEWCISRQRAWGVPIPALYDIVTNEALLSKESVSHIISVINERGIDAWWTDDDLDPAWTPKHLRNSDGQTSYRRGGDTMDVWFDSGTSWTRTEKASEIDSHVADCYIEGTDQHRGWFQSSLLTHVAHQKSVSRTRDHPKAPFKTLITHGFTLDQEGRKMSKSVGNVISPEEMIEGTLLGNTTKEINGKTTHIQNAMGPDALRLWVARVDYTSDIKVSQKTLESVTKNLSKYRVTFKLLLGMLSDFHPASSPEPLSPIHLIALHRLATRASKVHFHYQNLDISMAVSDVMRYVITDLSATYFEWIKDAAYCGTPSQRLQVQITLYHIFNHLQQMLLPITPLLVEEVWEHTPAQIKAYEGEIPPARRPRLPSPLSDRPIYEDLETDIPHLTNLLSAVKTTQEVARAHKKMGDSLQSFVYFEPTSAEVRQLFRRYGTAQLEMILGVSKVEFSDDDGGDGANLEEMQRAEWRLEGAVEVLGETVRLWVYQPQMGKCARCWRYAVAGEVEEDGERELCDRCEGVVAEMRVKRPELFE